MPRSSESCSLPYLFLLFISAVSAAVWIMSLSSWSPLSLFPPQASLPPLGPSVACITLPPQYDPVPRLLHWVYAQPPYGPVEISFLKWLSMTSAVTSLRPERIMFHTEVGRLPVGFWWDRFWKAHGHLVQVIEHDPVTSVYGHRVEVMAHKTDVIRLDAIYNHGGVYLDGDVLVFHDFLSSVNDHLRLHPEQDAVLAAERDGSYSYGNAVIMARPFSKFIALWKRGYHDFNDDMWSHHSTYYPRVLHQEHPGLLHRLPSSSFYMPDWDEVSLGAAILSGKQDYQFEQAKALGWHWWGHEVESQLGEFTPCTVRAQANHTVVRRLVGHLVTEELCHLWMANTTSYSHK